MYVNPVKKIKDFLRSTKYGIQNLIRWGPTIWKDRDWDHWFLYKNLQFKLLQMEKYQRQYGISTNANKIADQIKVCTNLLDRLIEDDYGENVFKNHNKKWGEPHLNFIPCKDKEDYSEVCITHDNVITEEDKKQERKEFRQLSLKEQELTKQDLDYLFKMMSKHIQGWWD